MQLVTLSTLCYVCPTQFLVSDLNLLIFCHHCCRHPSYTSLFPCICFTSLVSISDPASVASVLLPVQTPSLSSDLAYFRLFFLFPLVLYSGFSLICVSHLSHQISPIFFSVQTAGIQSQCACMCSVSLALPVYTS